MLLSIGKENLLIGNVFIRVRSLCFSPVGTIKVAVQHERLFETCKTFSLTVLHSLETFKVASTLSVSLTFACSVLQNKYFWNLAFIQTPKQNHSSVSYCTVLLQQRQRNSRNSVFNVLSHKLFVV